jgi:hypothetical protein
MRIIRTVCLFLALVAIKLNAQTTPPPTPDATYLGTFSVSHQFEVMQGTVKKQDVMDYNLCVWRTGAGSVELTINPDSISVDDDGLIDDMTAEEIFRMLADRGVREGISQGYLPAPQSSSQTTAVSYASCVNRSGSGSGTTFSAASSTLVRQSFSYCTTAVTSPGCTGATSCGGTAEPTCTSGAGLN